MTCLVPLAYLVLSGGPRWNTTFTKSFRVDATGPPSYVVAVSWFGVANDPFNGKWPAATMFDLYELDGIGGKTLVSSTKVMDGVWVGEVAHHAYLPHPSYEDKNGQFHKFFPIHFIATEMNGGQHSRTFVW